MDNFTLIKNEDGNYLVHEQLNNIPLQTHLNNNYPGLSEEVATILLSDLNALSEEQVNEKAYSTSLVYCVLSSLIEAGEKFDFSIELSAAIQWDFVYRLAPDHKFKKLQYLAIEPIVDFLKSSWEDLPLNNAKSQEDMEKLGILKVSSDNTNALSKLVGKLNKTEKFCVDLLFNLFDRGSITCALAWVAEIINDREYVVIDQFFMGEKDTKSFTSREEVNINLMTSRLSRLRELLMLSKNKALISE